MVLFIIQTCEQFEFQAKFPYRHIHIILSDDVPPAPIVKCVLSWLYKAPKEIVNQYRIILSLVGLLVISAGLLVIDLLHVINLCTAKNYQKKNIFKPI